MNDPRYIAGDVTAAFIERAGPKTRKVFAACKFEILLRPLPTDRWEGLERLIGRGTGTANYYQLTFEGRVIESRLELPRDVYTIILGIGYGRGIIDAAG